MILDQNHSENKCLLQRKLSISSERGAETLQTEHNGKLSIHYTNKNVSKEVKFKQALNLESRTQEADMGSQFSMPKLDINVLRVESGAHS